MSQYIWKRKWPSLTSILYWAISGKSKQVEGGIFTLPLEISGKTNFFCGISVKLFYTLWKFHMIFSWSFPEVPLLFKMSSGISTSSFFNLPGHSRSSNPQFGFFSRIAYSLLNTMKLFNKSVICVINSCLLFRAQQIAHTVTSVHTTCT